MQEAQVHADKSNKCCVTQTLIDSTHAVQVMTDFDNMCAKLLSEDAAAEASLQLSRFRLQEGRFGTQVARRNATRMPAWKWWMQYGSDVPELQELALKVLSQCSSACSCERNWSSYGFIHSKARCRLKASRARDLVYVFSNLKMLKKLAAEDYNEQFPLWDSDSESESDAE